MADTVTQPLPLTEREIALNRAAWFGSVGQALSAPGTVGSRLGGASTQLTANMAAADQQSIQNQLMERYVKAAEKAAKKKKGILGSVGSLLGGGIGAALAIPTGGMSVLAGAELGSMLGGSAGGTIDAFSGNGGGTTQGMSTQMMQSMMQPTTPATTVATIAPSQIQNPIDPSGSNSPFPKRRFNTTPEENPWQYAFGYPRQTLYNYPDTYVGRPIGQ